MVDNIPKELKSSAAKINRVWSATVVTLFPEMFPGPLGQSLAGKALDDKIWSIDTVDIRGFASDNKQTVDDAPFGGGVGMVMRADVVDSALVSINKSNTFPLIYVTPRGKPLTQARVKELAAGHGVVLLCGRYEGIDNRVIEAWDFEEVSLGDFVLSGGEPAALALIDACVRLLPGVIGNEMASIEESFEGGLLEYPHYTRPQTWEDIQGNKHEVPDVLTSGHHEKIDKWRKEKSVEKTKELRPDLFKKEIQNE